MKKHSAMNLDAHDRAIAKLVDAAKKRLAARVFPWESDLERQRLRKLLYATPDRRQNITTVQG